MQNVTPKILSSPILTSDTADVKGFVKFESLQLFTSEIGCTGIVFGREEPKTVHIEELLVPSLTCNQELQCIHLEKSIKC